ncbi:MAG: dihydropteroate synthase, partial [Planctomycetales bacterium 12-60-4]
DLPEHFGRAAHPPPTLTESSIEILAEINHAPRLPPDELQRIAADYRRSGADVIDLGCIPGECWTEIGAAVRSLIAGGFRVSVDSFDRREVTDAVENGAELVLSVNQSNIDWATDIPAEFVAIPDTPENIDTLVATGVAMAERGCAVRWDPILEPIGFGFATSLSRYFDVRRRFPDVPMMMGTGNVTELSEVDSSGVNFLLAAICEELRIGSILTTEVINWCRTSVREFDAARKLVRYSLRERRLPKHLDGRLLLLRDPKLHALGDDGLRQLANRITDPNFRIFAERGEVHLLNRDGYWHGDDPYEVFDRMLASVGSLSSEHAFYLGMELMKARTALTLGKQYVQDEALRWGFLTVEETSAVERRKDHRQSRTGSAPSQSSGEET